jgi:hypothetical protein
VGGGLELTGGGGLELVVEGDGVDEQLLQLRLALPLCRLLGIPCSTLLDQHEDAGKGCFVDVVLRPNPRPPERPPRGGGRGGGGGGGASTSILT